MDVVEVDVGAAAAAVVNCVMPLLSLVGLHLLAGVLGVELVPLPVAMLVMPLLSLAGGQGAGVVCWWWMRLLPAWLI